MKKCREYKPLCSSFALNNDIVITVAYRHLAAGERSGVGRYCGVDKTSRLLSVVETVNSVVGMRGPAARARAAWLGRARQGSGSTVGLYRRALH